MVCWLDRRKPGLKEPAKGILVLLQLGMALTGRTSEPQGDPARFDPPAVLTATIYTMDTGKPLFKFKRTTTQTGTTVRVLREYTSLDGKVAARERVEYRDGLATRYDLEELQTGAEGTIVFDRRANDPDNGQMEFRYSATPHASNSSRTEPLRPDTLLNETVGPFLADHFDQLAQGEKVACRCAVITHRQTVGFSLKKESEGRWHEKDVITVRMEPSSFLISALVSPLHLVIEKAATHRVLEYRGRTTPKTGRPGHWSDLDAVTVFDW